MDGWMDRSCYGRAGIAYVCSQQIGFGSSIHTYLQSVGVIDDVGHAGLLAQRRNLHHLRE